MSATIKTVQYAYPTSTNAEQYGFWNDGCYTVELSPNPSTPARAIAGFPRREEALAYAKDLPYAWCPLFDRIHPSDAK